MNAYQYNTLNMFHGVNGVLESNMEIFSDIPMIVKTAEDFAKVVREIDTIASQAETDTSGVTSEKSKVKDLLAQKTRYLAGAAAAYAFDQNDLMMSAALSYSFSDIRYTKDSQTLQIALTVLSEIEPHAEVLVEYGITAEELADFSQTIEDYNDLLEEKVEVRATGVAETKQLSYLIKHGTNLLNEKLDGFLYRYKQNQSNFYDAYRNARMIVDL